ncbi:MAG: 16S rRNA (guanine(527)-N(7))-methyltransferase RsmG, partial [Clostridia bacterium]|nr:16S rRNA (guanine(527)-N(7))-methyltransferase RsmG [Clostridia bacterium]
MSDEIKENVVLEGAKNAGDAGKKPLTREMLLSVMPGLTEAQITRFCIYYDRLITRNYRVNLTRITDPAEVASKHFADSILAADLIPEGASVIDVGTGAGFPGIPLKLVRPDIDLLLVDSLGKRILFLRELCSELGLDVPAVHARAEDAARDRELRGRFDFAVSRAVAPMSILTELTIPFVKVGGASLMYKGPNAAEEIAS